MDAFTDRDDDRRLWVAIGAIAGALVAFALFRYVGVLVTAIFLYYATRPIHRWIDARVPYANVAVTLTLLTVVVPMAFVVGYALFLVAMELESALGGGSVPSTRPYVQPYLRLARQGEFQALADAFAPSSGVGSTTDRVRTLANGVVGVASLAFAVVAQVFLLLVFLFYLLRDDQAIAAWFYDAVDHDERIVAFTQAVDDDLETVFFNNLVLVVLTAIEAAVVYAGMNLLAPGGTVVGTPVLLGALIGIGTIVPVVGMKIVYLPYAGYLGVLAATTETPLWHPLVFLAVSAIVVDTIPDVFLRTYLSARGSIHLGLILLGYVLGTMAFGWYGLFLGPILVVVTFHFAHEAFPWLATAYLGD
ncbi:AI-2E family transporter [Salinarchaeum chitinilyticum]